MSGAELIQTTVRAPDAPALEQLVGREIADEVDEYFEAGMQVRPGDVVVDVGANVGAFAARIAERTLGQVTIHCFEPAPATFAQLEQTCARHAWLSRARTSVHRVALTHPEGRGREVPFYFFSRIPTNSTYDLADKHAEYVAYFVGKSRRLASILDARLPVVGTALGRLVTVVAARVLHRENRLFLWSAERATGMEVVPCRTESLERWARDHGVSRIDLLKIDVEGAELDVLLGCEGLWEGIRCVAVEAHERDGRADAIERLLVERGLTSVRRVRPRITESTGLDNVLLVATRGTESEQEGT